MKTNTIRTLIVLLLTAGVVALIGCAGGGEQTITGRVEKTEKGHLLTASDSAATYQLVENQDFSSMVGQKVAITGTVLERTAGNYISVARFEVIGGGGVVKAEDAAKD